MNQENLKPVSRMENLVVQKLADEILIYDLKTHEAFCLNETSALIWQLCDGKTSVTEISQILTRQSKQPITEDLIWLALNDFKKENLLEQSEQFEIDFNGLTRRQIIRKVGFASMILLPIVSSLVAPSAAMAQSGGLPLNASCGSSSQCASRNCLDTGVIGSVCCNSSSTGGTIAGIPAPPLLTFCSTNADCAPVAKNCCSGIAFCTGHCVCGG